MKKLLIFVFALVATSVSAQYYVSVSGGAQMGSAGVLMGTELNTAKTQATNEYGSFGEGLNAQLRGGYFFNKTFGIEVALGYLHGADQVKDSYKNYYTIVPTVGNSTALVNEVTKVKAYGRAYGFSAALIYNFNDNIYGKFGAVTKVGGKTVAEATQSVDVILAEDYKLYSVNPDGTLKTTIAVPNGTKLKNVTTNLEQEFNGRIPLGFIAAMGYKYKLSDNLNFFAELEYLGINVTRDKSKYTKFNSLDSTTPTTPTTLAMLPVSMKEFTYVDELPVPYANTDTTKPTKVLSEVAPYSSFGLNIGITYSFGK